MTSSVRKPLAYLLARPLGWAVLVAWTLLFASGLLAVASPDVAALLQASMPVVQFVGMMIAFGLFLVWLAAALLLADAPMSKASKKRWIIALVLCNLIAGAVFVLWRYPRSLEEQQEAE